MSALFNLYLTLSIDPDNARSALWISFLEVWIAESKPASSRHKFLQGKEREKETVNTPIYLQ
jgi:hypothetical protein